MAVRIPVYTQQTATPRGGISMGNPIAVSGPDVGGALMNLAQGIGSIARAREEQKESVAAAGAAERLAAAQVALAQRKTELYLNAPEGGTGVVDAITADVDAETEKLLAEATTERSREFLRDGMLRLKTSLQLDAIDFQNRSMQVYIGAAIDRGTESVASLAAQVPQMAETAVAEQVAAIRAARGISEVEKTAKITKLIDTVSDAYVAGEVERDPYGSRARLLSRLGVDPGTTPQQIVTMRETAVQMLAEIESRDGFTLPPEQEAEAVARLMAGKELRVRDGQLEPEQSDAPFGYRDLTPFRVIEYLGRAEAEIARREQDAKQRDMAGKVAFDQRMQNVQIQLVNGEPAQIPSWGEIARYYGSEVADEKMREFAVYSSMQGQLASMDGMTNEEIIAAIAVPPTGEANREYRERAYGVVRQRAEAIITARKNDPGQYVLQNNAPVRDAFSVYTAEQERIAGLQGQVSGEELDAFIQMQTDYIDKSRAAQQELGIRNPLLPKQFVSGITTAFSDGLKSNNPQAAAAMLEAAVSRMSDSPDAVRQVLSETGPLGQLAAAGVDGLTLKTLQETMAMPEQDMKRLLPVGITSRQVNEAIAAEFAPLDATFAAAQDNQSPIVFRDAAFALAVNYMTQGKMSATEAARKAYQTLVTTNNEIIDTYRVDRRMYDPGLVQAGLEAYLAGPMAEEIQVVADAGFTVEESLSRKARTVRSQHVWVNDETGRGVFLMHANGFVKDRNGNPIMIPFSRAVELSRLPVYKRPAEVVTPLLIPGVR